jgi:dihydrofolate reductase
VSISALAVRLPGVTGRDTGAPAASDGKDSTVGRIIVTEFVSLDGVFEEPQDWHFPSFLGDEQAMQYKADELRATDALLLGRKTYEGFAAAWPERSGDEFSDTFNSMPKHVVSTTLENPTWTNSHVIRGDLGTELGKLRDQYAQDISIHGSGDLANSLLREGLIDEIRLMVHPTVVGAGRKFFDERTSIPDLHLVDVSVYEHGIVLLTYRPTNAPPGEQPAQEA